MQAHLAYLLRPQADQTAQVRACKCYNPFVSAGAAGGWHSLCRDRTLSRSCALCDAAQTSRQWFLFTFAIFPDRVLVRSQSGAPRH